MKVLSVYLTYVEYFFKKKSPATKIPYQIDLPIFDI